MLPNLVSSYNHLCTWRKLDQGLGKEESERGSVGLLSMASSREPQRQSSVAEGLREKQRVAMWREGIGEGEGK